MAIKDYLADRVELDELNSYFRGVVWKDWDHRWYGWENEFDPQDVESIEWWLYSRWNVSCDHCKNLRIARSWIPEEVDAFERLRKNDWPSGLEGGVDTDKGPIMIGFSYGD